MEKHGMKGEELVVSGFWGSPSAIVYSQGAFQVKGKNKAGDHPSRWPPAYVVYVCHNWQDLEKMELEERGEENATKWRTWASAVILNLPEDLTGWDFF